MVEIAGVRIGMVHDAGAAAGRSARMAARFPDCQVVVFGHSHQPLIERVADLLLLNPGSAIDRRREPVCTMAVVDVADGRLDARLIDLPEARSGLPAWIARPPHDTTKRAASAGKGTDRVLTPEFAILGSDPRT